MGKEKIPQELLDKEELEKTGMIRGERSIDIIRRMNPGRFIPTGAGLAKMIRDREKDNKKEK
jgi:hypothetical protein